MSLYGVIIQCYIINAKSINWQVSGVTSCRGASGGNFNIISVGGTKIIFGYRAQNYSLIINS